MQLLLLNFVYEAQLASGPPVRKQALLKLKETEESSGKPFPGCVFSLIRVENLLTELNSSGFASAVTRARRSSGLAAYPGPGWILQRTKLGVTGDYAVWGGRELGNVSLNSVHS